MSHMAQLNAPLPPAFRLVRRILAERPRQFQDLLREALALHTTESGDVAASSSTPTTVPAPPRRASGKGKKAENLAIKFPEGHPFVSANFLKRRVLPVLQSQRLIHIKPVREESTSKAHTQFVWHISNPIHDLTPSTQFPNLRPWDPAEHWDRLIAGVHPAETAADLNTLLEKRDEAKKEKAYADGREKRPEREIWRWEGREPELTTRLERLHLNRRKQRARPGKERKWMALRKGMETRRAEAREIVRKEIEEGRRAAEAGKLKRLKIEEDKSASNLP